MDKISNSSEMSDRAEDKIDVPRLLNVLDRHNDLLARDRTALSVFDAATPALFTEITIRHRAQETMRLPEEITFRGCSVCLEEIGRTRHDPVLGVEAEELILADHRRLRDGERGGAGRGNWGEEKILEGRGVRTRN